MGIVITGASGFIGGNIVPVLMKTGEDLLLVGRSEERLKALFPNMVVTSYDNFDTTAMGFETLVHLSIRNNNMPGDIEEFREANVAHLKAVLQMARSASVKTFIYISSLQATQITLKSPYAESKQEAEALLSQFTGMAIVRLKVPAVYGSSFAGKLRLLLKLPTVLRPFVFSFLASLRPTVHADRVAAAILNNARSQEGMELVITDQQIGNSFYAMAMKIVDICFAVSVIVFLWWLLVIVWVTIKLGTPGPGIIAQARVGKNGRTFKCYKFRTMFKDTRQMGTHEAEPSNITYVGGFLRKTKIDELPQVLNILKNDMSLVGPRPCLPVQNELVAARIKFGVLDVKGGITGWAQIKGVDMSDVDKLVKLDAEYIALRTIIMDLKIIVATATGRKQ